MRDDRSLKSIDVLTASPSPMHRHHLKGFAMSWGWKITILYLGFVGMILTFVIASTQQDFHLVSENYYAEEIAYQTRIDQMTAAQSLANPLEMSLNLQAKELLIKFPRDHQDLEGTLVFYRPSDSEQDLSYELRANASQTQTISTADLAAGLWKAQVSWTSGGEAFYQEKVLYW